MARHTQPVCRLCRREGEKLFLKGSRCLTNKCAFERRSYAPGQHGPNTKSKRNKTSDYATQLREKQKMRRMYGVLETQFRRYFREASRRKGVTGAEMLILLERRLDNVIYRAGLAPSRSAARQLVTHAHFNINGHPIDVPSYLVKQGDKIAVREVSRGETYWKNVVAESNASAPAPAWLTTDRQTLNATINALPRRDEIDVPLKEQLVVEYYSR